MAVAAFVREGHRARSTRATRGGLFRLGLVALPIFHLHCTGAFAVAARSANGTQLICAKAAGVTGWALASIAAAGVNMLCALG